MTKNRIFFRKMTLINLYISIEKIIFLIEITDFLFFIGEIFHMLHRSPMFSIINFMYFSLIFAFLRKLAFVEHFPSSVSFYQTLFQWLSSLVFTLVYLAYPVLLCECSIFLNGTSRTIKRKCRKCCRGFLA